MLGSWNGRGQELETFDIEVGHHDRQPGDVSARPREARDVTRFLGVRVHREDDRNRRCRGLSGLCVYRLRVTITSTLSRTRSPARSRSRAGLPSAHRDSISMLLSSIQPRSFRPDRKVCHSRASDGSSADSPRIPTRYTFPASCASLRSGVMRLTARITASPTSASQRVTPRCLSTRY